MVGENFNSIYIKIFIYILLAKNSPIEIENKQLNN